MSVEIQFPVEFVVQGTAVSLQSRQRRRKALREWQSRVKEASRSALPEGHFLSENPIAVTLYYFPAAATQGDVDNIVKPILDAMNNHIYMTDHQIQRVLVQKFEPNNIFNFSSPSEVLRDALERRPPILYVRLSDDPFEELV